MFGETNVGARDEIFYFIFTYSFTGNKQKAKNAANGD